MPDRKRVEEFITAVVGGDHVQAIADFYHEDASMQENSEAPRVGRDLLLKHERNALRRVQAIETRPVKTFLVDDEVVVVHWVFVATDRAGVKRRLEELALQRWRGDRIQEERFFYDTALAWQAIE